jgi:hypothetical protein
MKINADEYYSFQFCGEDDYLEYIPVYRYIMYDELIIARKWIAPILNCWYRLRDCWNQYKWDDANLMLDLGHLSPGERWYGWRGVR